MDLEVWKLITVDRDSGAQLLISNFGNVKGVDWGDRSKLNHSGGYLKASHYVGGNITRMWFIHRLVAALFCKKPTEDHSQVNHIDGDKQNNHHKNLEWVTPSRNIRHAHTEGLMNSRKNVKTLKSYSDDVILKAYLEVMLEFDTITKVAEKYGMPRTTLSSIVNGRCKKKITGL